MNKIFITKANTKLILKSLLQYADIKEKRDYYLDELSENFDRELLNVIFNDNEIKDIYYQKNILKDLDSLLKQVKDNKNIVINYINKQNKLYAYDIKEPSYHNKSDCQWLNSDFHNIEIPKFIQKDDIKRKKFKNFIYQNKNLSFMALNMLYKKEFDSSDNLKEINLKNSGNTSLNNIKFLSEIDDFTKKFLNDEEIKKIKYASIYNLDKIIKTIHNAKRKSRIQKFRDIKKKFLDYIFVFHKEKYNKNLSFDKTILENIGFNECHGCQAHNTNYTNDLTYGYAS